jgi:aryl-alcohol dehydrogenase-like predicted oxidoreductase
MSRIETTWHDGTPLPRLGLGTWAIGGPWTAGGEQAGWGETDDRQSRAAILAGVAAGVRLFDTAQAYGAGHAERLLGDTLADRPDVKIVTKVGLLVDEGKRELIRATTDPDEIGHSIDGSRRRLKRDRIDMVLLHLNSASPEEAAGLFDRLETLRAKGIIGAYGWSTDFPDRAEAFAHMPGFAGVEHAMNVFFPATAIRAVSRRRGLAGLVRSPLAMGLLGGRYRAGDGFGPQDVRARTMDWMDYFKGGRVTESHAVMLDSVRTALGAGGRSMAQGALGWILAADDHLVPVPGFRTEAQVSDLAGTLARGPLSPAEFAGVENAITRPKEGPPRER